MLLAFNIFSKDFTSGKHHELLPSCQRGLPSCHKELLITRLVGHKHLKIEWLLNRAGGQVVRNADTGGVVKIIGLHSVQLFFSDNVQCPRVRWPNTSMPCRCQLHRRQHFSLDKFMFSA
jgi:hypothetical protein